MPANLHELFDAVTDLPEDAQLAALRSLTQDEALIKKVLRMCGHAQTNATVIASAIAQGASNLTTALSNELKAGDTLDTWKLTEKIGQGGMGSVFLAERTDGHFQQTVAIKVMHGLPTATAIARLAQERQILAGLTHPNIARLFDGGATPNGQPYLVLEYIKGLPIDAYCQSNNLGFVQILELMLPICDAVAIAHQRLIIHCDIKPANILVSQAGRPSLLDFGIANLAGEAQLLAPAPPELDADLFSPQPDVLDQPNQPNQPDQPDQPAHFTQSTMRGNVAVAYTPRYASPEQKASKPITTATDIYSLGRVLEELAALDPVYRHDNPRGKASGKARLQSDELQAIIDKACADIPAARYGSAQAMAADIKNVLRGAKVEAAAIVPGYASRKWISQHWLKAAAALLFFAVVSGFTLKVIAEKNRAELQASNAETERSKAEIERKKAELERVKAEAERAKAEAERAEAEAQRQTATQARKVAEDAQKQAISAQKIAVTEKAKAQKSEQVAVQERDRVTVAKKSVETINNFLVSIFEGVNPSAGGNRNASARDLIKFAEKKLDAIKEAEPEAQAELFKSLAFIQSNLGEQKASADYNVRAADAYAVAGAPFNRKRAYALTLASTSLSRLDPPRAATLAVQAVNLARQNKDKEPRAYAASLNALILGFHAAERYADAKSVIEEMRAIYKTMEGDPWAINGYPVFHYNTAKNLYHLGQYAEAENAIRTQIAYRLTVTPVHEQLLTAAYQLLGNTLHKQNKTAEAAATFKLGLARSASKLGEDNPTYLALLGNYKQFLKDSGYHDPSLPPQQDAKP